MKQIAVCFNLMMAVQEVKDYIKTLEAAIGSSGGKIAALHFEDRLSCNGIKIDNVWRNKVVLDITKRKSDEPVISDSIMFQFIEFFNGKVISDKMAEEMKMLSEK